MPLGSTNTTGTPCVGAPVPCGSSTVTVTTPCAGASIPNPSLGPLASSNTPFTGLHATTHEANAANDLISSGYLRSAIGRVIYVRQHARWSVRHAVRDRDRGSARIGRGARSHRGRRQRADRGGARGEARDRGGRAIGTPRE